MGSDNDKKEVFVSYSHLDKEYLLDMRKHLYSLQNSILYWDDSFILAGEKWESKIQSALECCKIAVLLVSANFFNSDYIRSKELPFLLERAEVGMINILIVIIRPCLFSEYPELTQYQSFNPPSETVMQMTVVERELFWVRLGLYIKQMATKPTVKNG